MIGYINILAALYIAANLIFSASAVFDTKWWDAIYFWYQDTAGAGWLVWLWIYLREREYRGRTLPVFIYSILIFIWDILSYITGWGVNNQVATGIGFGLVALIVTLFMVRDIMSRIKEL